MKSDYVPETDLAAVLYQIQYGLAKGKAGQVRCRRYSLKEAEKLGISESCWRAVMGYSRER